MTEVFKDIYQRTGLQNDQYENVLHKMIADGIIKMMLNTYIHLNGKRLRPCPFTGLNERISTHK